MTTPDDRLDLLAKYNTAVRERDEARDKLTRANPLAHVDLDEVCERLSRAAYRLQHVMGHGDDHNRITEAVEAMTDTVRLLEAGR